MAIYTPEEFASYVQSDVDTNTALLLRDLVTGLIDELATFTTYPVSVKAIALEAAARAYRNPEGVQSKTRNIDDYSTTDRWDASSAGVFLTDAERADVAVAGGIGSNAAFTISPFYDSTTPLSLGWWETA